MIRLYKRDETGKPAAYHEAWIEPHNKRIVEHWGYLGDAGDTATHRIKILGSLEKQFTGVLQPARELGFEELSDGELSALVVSYPVKGQGTDADHDKRDDIQDALNEKLGWTGLGHCDEGRIHAGAMEICCRVVDVDLAKKVITEALDGSEFADYSSIYQE